jgi:hypothetical protein
MGLLWLLLLLLLCVAGVLVEWNAVLLLLLQGGVLVDVPIGHGRLGIACATSRSGRKRDG